jgi:DeoR/GlpR family transcriptional regulator of sugar metabolism
MKKEERQNHIRNMLNSTGTVTVNEIMQELSVSDMTVRRDLSEMAQQGLLIRTHGGAYLVEKYDKSYPTNLRKAYLSRTKDKMAQIALSYIQDNEVIMLDSSTTCMALFEAAVQSQKPLTIITNSLQIMSYCDDNNTNINLICVGGTFRKRTSSCADQHTVDMLRNFRADRAFISCPKLTIEYGLSDNHNSEARVRESMLKQSKFGVVIADHTKFDESANILFNGLEDLDLIITDQKFGEDWEEYTDRMGIKVEYCGE